MTNVVSKKLPHGAIPFAQVKDVTVRSVVMKLNENMLSIKSQLEAAQAAINELKRRS